MTKRVPTYKEKRQMEDLILANSLPLHNGDLSRRVWKLGWSPAVVAQTIGDGINAHHVRGFARTLGLFFSTQAVEGSTAERLADHETRLAKLEAWMEEMNA